MAKVPGRIRILHPQMDYHGACMHFQLHIDVLAEKIGTFALLTRELVRKRGGSQSYRAA